jgi:class 3 adenylate cyclase
MPLKTAIRSLRDVSIRTKLASLVALNVVVLAVVAFYCVRQVRCVRQEIHEIADQDIPLTRALTGLAHDQDETDARLERALRLAGVRPADAGPAAVAAARDRLARVEGTEGGDLAAGRQVARQALAEAQSTDERKEFADVLASLDRIGKEYADYAGVAGQVLDLAGAGRAAEAEARLPALEKEEAELDGEVAALASQVEGFTADSARHVEMHEQEVIRHITLAGIAGVVGGLGLGFVYGRSITRRLRVAVGVANRLAAGERNFDVPVEGRDEAGALLAAMRVMAGEVTRSEAGLKHEQQRSERLLLNILPRPIAERLKDDHRAIADGFAEVSVLFADVVGFTAMSARMPPADLVRVLNRVFSLFDTLAERHGLEKIKTIGDCYMAVAGIPTPRADHARAVADMALDMQAALAEFDTGTPDRLRIRIGINSGPVVAGVIGLRKFIYDLWGDTVNVASRMESTGVAGAVQVSEATHRLLQDDFAFEPRGPVHVKGKGDMNTWLLTGRRIVKSAA